MNTRIMSTFLMGILIGNLHAMESQPFAVEQLRELFSSTYANREQDLVDQLKKMDPIFNCCKKGDKELLAIVRLMRKFDYKKFCLTQAKTDLANNAAYNNDNNREYKEQVKDTLLKFTLLNNTLTYNRGFLTGVGVTIVAWVVATYISCYLTTMCMLDY